MADAAHPVPSARQVSHRQGSSQTEFTKRLKHLQRSDPVDPKELTRRLNVAIAEARNGGGNRRRRTVNTRPINGNHSNSRTPSAGTSPKQNNKPSPSTLLDIARSSLVSDGPNEDDDPLSRVARALRACRDADPQRPIPAPTRREEESSKKRRDFTADIHDEFAEVTKAVARKSVVFSAPRVVEIERPREPMPRPPTTLPAPNIAKAMKKRTSRKAPPPLILTVMPKATRPEIVDVSSPITTKPPSALPDLQPLSPFGANFTENGGSFLVYQATELRHSAISVSSVGAASSGPASPESPAKPFSPTTVIASPPGQSNAHDTLPEDSSHGERRKNIPSIALSENGETDDTDVQSDRTASPVFEASAAQSSRTSLGQHPVTAQNELKRQLSKGIEVTKEQVVDTGYETVQSPVVVQNPRPEHAPSRPVSPLTRTMTRETTTGDDYDVSPLGSPTFMVLPQRLSSLPSSQQQAPNPKRFSIPRKPVGSGSYDNYMSEKRLSKQEHSVRSARHDSTGFTVAREFLRDSIDGEHVRHVHSAAHLSGDVSPIVQEPADMTPQLPKLTTPGPKPGQWEVIADGIALIDSDSPTIGKLAQKLPTPTIPQFREPSESKESSVRSTGSRQSSSFAESPTAKRSSPPSPQPQQDLPADVDVEESPAAAVTRVLSRTRRGTDATITSFSSKPDYRARPLIQDAPELPSSQTSIVRPRTAVPKLPSQPPPVPSLPAKLPSKMPTKIKFPPRANNSEVAAMSPESLKLLHEQEALLRKRYDAVLNPIDDALKKKAAEQTTEPASQEMRKNSHAHSKSADMQFTVKAMPVLNADIDFVRQQEQIAREQAAIRAQRRNLGTAARRPSGADEMEYYDLSPREQQAFGDAMGLPSGFPSPAVNTKSAFTFDDDTQGKRRKGKWKFWKAK